MNLTTSNKIIQNNTTTALLKVLLYLIGASEYCLSIDILCVKPHSCGIDTLTPMEKLKGSTPGISPKLDDYKYPIKG